MAQEFGIGPKIKQANEAIEKRINEQNRPFQLTLAQGIFMSVGTIFGAGGTSVISRAYGEGKNDYASKVGSFCMWSSIGIGTLLTILMLVFMEPLLHAIGASENTYAYTRTCLFIVSFCGPFSMVSSCFSNVQRAEGQVTRAMIGQLIGNLLNMCLDPLFISGFGWGITGCALATLIGETAGAVCCLQYYIRGKSALDVRLGNFTVRNHVAQGVLSIGIPAALGGILMSLSQIIRNAKMAAYGDMAVAGIGAAMKIAMITGMISMGIGQGYSRFLGIASVQGPGRDSARTCALPCSLPRFSGSGLRSSATPLTGRS